MGPERRGSLQTEELAVPLLPSLSFTSFKDEKELAGYYWLRSFMDRYSKIAKLWHSNARAA
jgi:hypothetical protein